MKPFLPALQEAVSFLTVLPVRSARHSPADAPERLGRAMAWFPLVGAGIGAAGAWVAGGAHTWWTPSVSTLLGLIAIILLTGGLHWDGFCDSMDGLAAHASPEETLRVMRDSRVGALGASAAFCGLTLQWALLQSIPSHRLLGAWVAAGSLSRWVIVFSAYSFPYAAGQQGLGRLATDRKNSISLWAATGLGIGFALCGLGPQRAGLALGVSAVGSGLLNRLFQSKLGGITGDTLGAVGVMTETLVLFCAAAR